MGTPFLLAWLVLVSILGLNGFAAGIVAVLHAWPNPYGRRTRVLLASGFAGLLPASALIAFGILRSPPPALGVLAAVFGIFLTIGAAVSLPGAIIVARKLEPPGDNYRAFE